MNRTESGRAAKASGDAFEEWLNVQHEKARLLGILAHVEKTEAHTKMVGSRLIYTEKGVADYIGCLEGGLYLALEAKSTKEARFARDNVSHKQQDHLDRVALAGGLALLLVEFRITISEYVMYKRFAVPWRDIRWQVKRTAETISADDLKEWEVFPECYLRRWHRGGTPSSAVKMKRYPRE